MDQNKIIRVNELSNILGVSFSTISRMEKRGEFPQRKRIGLRAVGWLESELMEWLTKKSQDNNRSGQVGEVARV